MTDGPTVPQRRLPIFLYGTAWKEERTEELTRMALAAGFRGIDTANQRKHYDEAAVGAAVAASGVTRTDLFLQTKYTYARGQDHRLPYDPKESIAAQVHKSCERSLQHLGADCIDSFLLHGPWSDHGWGAQDREAWRAMEELRQAGQVRLLGVSNISREQLGKLCEEATLPPTFVQNRCYARTGWDKDVRDLCRKMGIVYQGFSLLTANRHELGSATMTGMAARLNQTVPQLVFRFALELGMLPLTGTSDRKQLQEDLASADLGLSAEDIAVIDRIGQRH
jgi:diketogulonate reductase-like aldo/keto reductase